MFSGKTWNRFMIQPFNAGKILFKIQALDNRTEPDFIWFHSIVQRWVTKNITKRWTTPNSFHSFRFAQFVSLISLRSVRFAHICMHYLNVSKANWAKRNKWNKLSEAKWVKWIWGVRAFVKGRTIEWNQIKSCPVRLSNAW